ncbi:hypothetical protein [Pasteurella multocida]|uniref:hypothetical protein n=1 Tax=Pasteurella multocida TaxID=747 RepID=UPI00224D0766|nr:hypothetical protein [Pasteurella multocida]UZU40041.1 hypothetical protein ORU25_04570 [Pasteurella multocida]
MARVRKKGDKTLSYSIEPHPKDWGLLLLSVLAKTKKTKQAGSAILLARIYAKQQ